MRRARSNGPAIGAVSDLDAHLGFWLRYVSNHVSGAFQKGVEAEGVSVSEWVALRQIYKVGPIAQGGLVASLGMTRGAVSKIVTRLEDKGLATRTVSAEDSRSWLLELTRSGRELVPRLANVADQNDLAFFGHLDPGVRAAMIETLKGIVSVRELHEIPVD